MLGQLKAFAGAGIFGLIGLGFQVSGFINPSFAYFCWGLATFWAIVALFRNKRLVQRFPGIVDWLPFLEDDPVALPKDLTGTYLRGHTLRLLDIAFLARIDGRTIEDCAIIGPAMIYMVGTSIVQNCGFDFEPETLVVETGPDARAITGVVLVNDTVFRRCHFRGIGFVGPSGTLKKIKGGFNEPAPKTPAQK